MEECQPAASQTPERYDFVSLIQMSNFNCCYRTNKLKIVPDLAQPAAVALAHHRQRLPSEPALVDAQAPLGQDRHLIVLTL